MAQFGAKRPVFAPIKTTPDGALPTYDYEKKVTIGKLVKADLTVTNASGELYGDDALAEKVDMFASGSLALETDDKTDEVQNRPAWCDEGHGKRRSHGLRRRRSPARRSCVLQGHHAQGYPLFQGHLPSRNKRQSSATTAPQQRVRLSRSARPTRRLRSSAAIPAHGVLRRNSQVTARKRIVLRGAIRNSANRQRVAAVKQSAERARGSIPPPALALWR